MKEIKILTPVGMLGYGFPVEDYQRGLLREPDAVILDSGSTDPGPYMLGTGSTPVKHRAYVRDLKVILEGIGSRKIPLLIGSAGGAGFDGNVDYIVKLVLELCEALGLQKKIVKIYADIPRELVSQKLKAGQISSCSCSPELTEKDLSETVRIVAQMGMEPILKALTDHPDADILVIGRLLPMVKAYVANLYPEVKTGEAKIIFHIYGKNAVMEEWEPIKDPVCHEVGILCEVVAPTQELASAICANTRVALLHGPYPGQLVTGGNLALPLNPPDSPLGPVCRFSVYPLMDIEDPVSLFPILTEEV